MPLKDLINSIVELETEAGLGAEWRIGRCATAGGAACRVGGAAEEAVVWEVTVKGGALGGGPSSSTIHIQMFAGKRTTSDIVMENCTMVGDASSYKVSLLK